MAATNAYELEVSEGKRSVLERILAAVFFVGLVYMLYLDAQLLYYGGINEKTGRLAANSLGVVGFCLAGGIRFSIIKAVLIDTDKDKLISRYSIGPFSYDKISEVPELEYVAVFKNDKELFEVNLWYKGNRHYGMYVFEEKKPAMDFAQKVSDKLKLDLLDATQKGNSKWIENIPEK